jgi:hypothetical protein
MPMGQRMRARVNDLVLVQGIRDTRTTLAGWNRDPGPVLRAWLFGSLAISVLLLLAVWMIAAISHPDPTPILLPGLNQKATIGSVAHVLLRNSLVLALHAFACEAGPLAIVFVIGATTFSLCTQAFALGGAASTLSAQLGISPGLLVLGLLPHALPELVALFLPLAAWIVASRRHEWDQLLAATFVTVAIAAPVLVVSSLVEVYVTPDLLRFLAG